jgi:DNA-binding LacI/PurR family transcriptional regulator
MDIHVKPRRAKRRTKPVRLSDVATAAGVSTATVSMVVNGNPRISSGTQKRVRRAIERLGYRPNRAAQRLTGRGSPALMVLLPAHRQTFADSYFGEIISGIAERAAAMGQIVQFEHATPELLRAGHHVSMLQQQAADGMLLLGFNDFHVFLNDFDEVASRVIVVDSHITRADLDSVTCDYSAGATQAMNYLLQLGHRRIGLITSSVGGRSADEIAETYRHVLALRGITVEDSWLADDKDTEQGGDAAADKILRNSDVTAILAASDRLAIGALHAAQRRGLSVPRDLSVVGFDNLRHSAFLNPSLTTVHLPLHEAGALACQRLVERIHGNTQRIADRLPTHLVVRNSTSLARDLPVSTVDSSAA